MEQKTKMTIHCKREFVEYVKTCLGFIGSGTYALDEDECLFSLNVNPMHKAMLRDFITGVMREEGYKNLGEIIQFNLNA